MTTKSTEHWVIVYRNKPEYKGLDAYIFDEQCVTTSEVARAMKFDHLLEAKEFIKTKNIPLTYDEEHFLREVVKVESLAGLYREVPTTTADDPATHNPQSAGALQEELIALTRKLITEMERKPCDTPCPVCGWAHIKRRYVNDRCAQDELRSPGISNVNRQFRTEPEVGKIHNTCECCHHEWNSDPLSKEADDDHQA